MWDLGSLTLPFHIGEEERAEIESWGGADGELGSSLTRLYVPLLLFFSKFSNYTLKVVFCM